ncbi:unnamed protein product [Adineta steineri]|uniref:Cation efflux protein transmembrane domain-containing protein n=1 Tax=Adineta steineri TaxID=433720 RepID=A0A815K742_9BILA|nr:unnamed protein product [Adineta steineri]CAF1391656.1 unnamed protein product [Adineta steineri]
MNLMQMHQYGNVNCLSQIKEIIDHDNNKPTFTRTVYQVDATTICRIIKRNEHKCLYKSFSQLLHLASKARHGKKKSNHIEQILLSKNIPDLIPVAIYWNPAHCTTSDVEDLVSIIDPFINLGELFYNETINDTHHVKELKLIGLICFYGGSIEVFFSYEHSTSEWLFCFDGNVIIITDWKSVIRKCIDFHLQPFLLIYVNSEENPVDITQLLKRTVIQENIIPDERRLEPSINSMTKQDQLELHENKYKNEIHSLENLSKISSFATLNSSMLFMPQSTINSSYINKETVVKVMQQQLLKKESLLDVTSLSSSSLVHIRKQYQQKQKSDETLSSEDSSTSSQRDSGLSSGINDESTDNSPRDSLVENETTTEIDSLIKQTEQMMNDTHFDMSLASIEFYLEQSVKYESASNYSSALESCQRALVLIDQILNLSQSCNTRLLSYLRPRKNSLLLRIRSLKKRQIEIEQLNYFPIKTNLERINENTTSILSSTRRLFRPKKNVKFSDHVALIVPTFNDTNESSSTEHLIHSFLRNIHQQQTSSDSDSDTPSSSLNDLRIGLIECSLCHKRFSKLNQMIDLSNQNLIYGSIEHFLSLRYDISQNKNLSKRAKHFYKRQNDIIDKYENILKDNNQQIIDPSIIKLKNRVKILTTLSLIVNVCLFFIKIFASILSNSLSIISSVIDSAVDLISSIILFWTSHAIRHRNQYKYPAGRKRLEPVAIIILSVIMCSASVQVLSEAIQRLFIYIKYFTNHTNDISDVNMNIKQPIPIIIMCITIMIKIILYFSCRNIPIETVKALAQDHRNDILSNCIALISGLIAGQTVSQQINIRFIMIDPIGAIIISIYIIISWIHQATKHIRHLTGVTAEPDFLKLITWIAINFSPYLTKIDMVKAFHFVDIGLPGTMQIQEAHDIGNNLQIKLESLPEIERAFVHIDYEFNHKPDEHKLI